MLAHQRQVEILRKLRNHGGARVAVLARELRVTAETIRRDLDKLERAGRLVRTHGGAVLVPEASRDLSFETRQSANHEAKVAIARLAARLVSAGDVIALDASSTVHELALALPDIPLTVVTNSLPATLRLAGRSQVRVIATGGMLDRPSGSWVGTLAEEALERLNIQKVFLSSKGVDFARGLSEVDDAQARVKRRMLDLAAERYLLVDSSKFGVRSVVPLARLHEVHAVLTDAGITVDARAQLAALRVALHVAE